MATVRPDWKMPEPPNVKCSCGKELNMPTYHVEYAGEDTEIILYWDCNEFHGDTGEYEIEWPFVENYILVHQLEEIGFQWDYS